MQRFFRPQLGNGETFLFLKDDWSGHGRLCGAFPRLYRLSMELGGGGVFGAVGLALCLDFAVTTALTD